MKKILIKYGVYAIIAFISSIFGFYTSSFEYFKFNSEINLVDFSSLIISSLIGIFIAFTVQRRLTTEKTEKDLLINEITQIKIDIKTIYNSVLNDNASLTNTVFLFKLTSSNLINLKDLLGICQIEVGEKIDTILSSVRTLNRRITYDSTAPNGTFIITEENKVLFFIEYRKLTALFFELIVEINRK